MNRKVLVDLGERDHRVRIEMEEKAQSLRIIRDKHPRVGLSAEQERQLKRYEYLLDHDEVIDPFYRAVVGTVLKTPDEQLEELLHEHGLVGTQKGAAPGVDISDEELEIIAICGLMQLDGITDPDREHFTKKVSEARGEYDSHLNLFRKVFNWLEARHNVSLESQIKQKLIYDGIIGCVEPGDTRYTISQRRDPDTGEMLGTINKRKVKPHITDHVIALSSKSLANVVRKLVSDRVSENDSFLETKIEAVFEGTTGSYDSGAISSMEIALPDLEEAVDVEIIKENLEAVQAIYFFMMLEEARLPQVVDYISEAWRRGAIALGKGTAGDALYRYHRTMPERLNEIERRNFFMGTFGTPGGDPEYGRDNALFYELMLRTTSAVSQYFRKFSRDNVFLSQESIRKACRELAANLSVNGYGMAHYTAVELQQTILDYRDLLSDPEVLRAFGSRDMWQVVDQVNANYLGGLRNTYRYRIQAHSGAIIIRWLANNHQRLVGRPGLDVISTDVLRSPHLRNIEGNRPLVKPSDWDFVNACEQWLAVGGVQDDSVDQYSQPIESPPIASKPTVMPQVARDVLESVGIDLPGM
ncbi:hypothetical protein [Aliikangiella coralliicola]|uniref:Uncharacterized protein n=1 Tax=Aliikangiella coralliicola TaxID=2592383 RepID=A0A545U971_9GAMM|nr:hypothetical protein [Aliikangiella coralliicola]TQV85963.1 hypothetical protein FLL46_18785 [Aliikangiella coralliicola]